MSDDTNSLLFMIHSNFGSSSYKKKDLHSYSCKKQKQKKDKHTINSIEPTMPGIMMNSFSSSSSLSSQWRRQRRTSLLSLSSTSMRKYNNDETGMQKCTTIRSDIRVRDRLGPYNSDENINGSMNGNNNRRYLYEKPNSCSVPFISPASSFSVPGRYSGRGGGGGGSRAMQYQYQWQEQDKSDSINNSNEDEEGGPWGHFVDL